MEAFAWIVAAVAIFGLCRAVDLLFHKLFLTLLYTLLRNHQHR